MQRGCIVYWKSVATKLVDPSSVISLIKYVTRMCLNGDMSLLLHIDMAPKPRARIKTC